MWDGGRGVGGGGHSSIEIEGEELAGCAVCWQMLINFPVDCAFYEALTGTRQQVRLTDRVNRVAG